MNTIITYTLRLVDEENPTTPIKDVDPYTTTYTYERAVKLAWFLYRKFDTLYAIQGSDGSIVALNPRHAIA
jgi:hypothetical protein